MDGPTRGSATQRLLLRQQTIDVWQGLTDANVGALVLKGAVLQSLLYDGEPRTSGDVDVLVDPRRWDLARRVLGDLGWRPAPVIGMGEHAIHSVTLQRRLRSGVVVELDLHHRLHGARVSSRAVWARAAQAPLLVELAPGVRVPTTDHAVTLYHLTVATLPELSSGPRHAREVELFHQRHPGWGPAAHEVATLWRADNVYRRGVAQASAASGTQVTWGQQEPVPEALPPRLPSMVLSAWVRNVRRAPTLRARTTLVVRALTERG